jgi:hypothetical protein
MFSSAIPGAPAWAQPPEVFDELIQVGHKVVNANNKTTQLNW